MKLIEQTRLFFRHGISDKVYEVDLCFVDRDEYVVNFRYGRRGKTLREGTKTVLPVSERKAREVYVKLVTEKKHKGYRETAGDDVSDGGFEEPTDEGRRAAVLKRLEAAVRGDHDEADWRLSRVVWRAGLLRIREAAPLIARLPRQGDELFTYSAAWALGRCGDSSVTSLLQGWYTDAGAPPALRRVCADALTGLLDGSRRDAFIDEKKASLPGSVRAALEDGRGETLPALVHELVVELKSADVGFLEVLYRLSRPGDHTWSAVYEVVKALYPSPSHFRVVRALFKSAEFRDDTPMYARISKMAYRVDCGVGIPWRSTACKSTWCDLFSARHD